MSQVPVKWAYPKSLLPKTQPDLYDLDGNRCVEVVELAALREVVEYLREQVKYHDPLCMDNIEEDGCTCGHATAQRLLTQLGEVK